MRQLPNGTPATPPPEESAAQALENYLAAAAEGKAPPRAEFLARHPELADDLDACLAAMRFIGRAAEAPRSAAAEVAEPQPPAQVPGQLGDFRIAREVGRGGMGVVYEAEQVSLGRRVALKVLPFAATMDARQLKRFHNEARAAASLDHPHIVHVHAVGCERGVHYYAMQFINGQTVAGLIADQCQRGSRPVPPEEQPTTAHVPGKPAAPSAETAPRAAASTERARRGRAHFRRVAEWGVQAAEALDHAHQLGVVHRDVKPGNLMLDEDGKLWVTDFGLAQVATEGGLTMTGDLVGTLRYMSPEQALAKRVPIDHRTDVYSLGATLYELLTLRPAVAGNDRQELLRRIAFEEPAPPRRLDRAVPAELETIVLKALEKNPADRYATAGELADDLRRFLEDKPIRARRPTLRQRLWKWCRRHRAVAAAAFLVLLAAIGALAASSYFFWHEHALTQKALWKANAQRERAHKRLELTINALDRMSITVGPRDARRDPEMEKVRNALLDAARRALEESLPDDTPDQLVREEAGRLHLAIGNVYRRQREFARAEEAYGKAVATYASLVAEFPDFVGYPPYLDVSRKNLDRVRASRRIAAGQTPEGFPGPSGDQRDLGRRYQELGDELRKDPRVKLVGDDHRGLFQDQPWFPIVGDEPGCQGWPWEAAAAYRQAVAVREKLVDGSPRAGDHHRDLIASCVALAGLMLELREKREQITMLERAAAVAEQLAVESPDPPRDARQRVRVYWQLGMVSAAAAGEWRQAGSAHEAEAADRRAEAAYRRAVKLAGGPLFGRSDDLAFGATVAGGTVPGTVQLAALGWCQEPAPRNVETSRDGILRQDVELYGDLVLCYTGLASLYEETGRPREAEQVYRHLLVLLVVFQEYVHAPAGEKPNSADDWLLANCRVALGHCLRSMNRHREAAEEYLKADEYYRKALATGSFLAVAKPFSNWAGDVDGRLLVLRSAKYNDIGGYTVAPVDMRYYKGLALCPPNMETKWSLYNDLAWLLATCPYPQVRDPVQAVELAQKAVAASASTPSKEPWKTLGVAHYRAGHYSEAVTALEKSRQLGDDSPHDWFFLAMARWQLGDKAEARAWYDKAVVWMEKNKGPVKQDNGVNDEPLRFRAEAAALLGIKDAQLQDKEKAPTLKP
jgi:serine/threonine protein kinase